MKQPMDFFVWWRGLRGPTPALHAEDPRKSIEWKSREEQLIALIPLTGGERELSLDQCIKAYPCPVRA